MKYSIKATLSLTILILILPFGSFTKAQTISKSKPTPNYTIDLENKQIIFINVAGSYIIDNEHLEVVKQGDIYKKNQTLDISDLEKGTYLLEIEHSRYIYTDLLVIE